MNTNIVSTAALLLSSALLQTQTSAVSASTPCAFSLEDEVAVGIANEVDLLLSPPDESLPTFNDQLRLMGFTGSPGDINDVSPPHQRVKFNSYLHSAHGNNYFTGYEGGEFLGYYPDELLFRWRPAGAFDANVKQRTAYTFDPINGDAMDIVSTDAYDPRVRGWYQDAMSKCTSDLLNTYTCELHWTAPFIFKSDGSLGITPALGFLDHATGLPLGVTAYGFRLSEVSTVLSDAVHGNEGMIAYIIEGDGLYIGVSNGDPITVNEVRLNARDSSDDSISKSAKMVVDEHYRSDQTLLVDGELITVKTFQKDDQLTWYIVVIEPYDVESTGGDENCVIGLESSTLQIAHGEVDLFLTNIMEAGDLTADALRLGLVSTYTPPSALDEAYGIQDYLWATIKNCDVTRKLYVGYEDDGTFVIVDREDLVSSFRAGDGSADTNRYYYHMDYETGEKTTGAFKSTVYDPRIRPWYQHAQQTGVGSFSPIYVFATGGELGITYSVPLYENGVFKGAVGADFSLAQIDALLAKQHEPGFGLFIFENEKTSADDAYDMVASSEIVVIANTTRQHKAYDRMMVENYYVAEVAQHLKDNSLVRDTDLVELEDVTASVLNYDARTLNWRIVAYDVIVDTQTTDTISDTSSSEDDDTIDSVMNLAAASVALLVIILVLAIMAVVYAKKSADSAGAGVGAGGGAATYPTQNPLSKDSHL